MPPASTKARARNIRSWLFHWRCNIISIGGEMNPMQHELLASAMKKLPQGGTVVIATDNDPAGDKYVQSIKDIASIAGNDGSGIASGAPLNRLQERREC